MSKYNNVGNIFGFSCTKCEHNRNCYGGNLGNQYRFCQKSREKLEDLDKLQQENQKYKEVFDKLKKLIVGKQEIQSEEAGFYDVFTSYITIDVDELLEILEEVE